MEDIFPELERYKKYRGIDYKEHLQYYAGKIKEYQNKKIYPKKFKSPLGVQLEITYGCNLNCIHCYNNSGNYKEQRKDLSTEQFLAVAEELVEIKVFECIISGGEPTIRKDLFELLDILDQNKIKLIFITNGWAVDEKMINKLSNYSYRWFQVSIDGYRPEIHDHIRGRKGSWKRAVNAAKLAADAGLPLVIAHLITKENIEDFEDMIDLALALDALEIIADEAIFTGRASDIYTKLKLSEKETKKFIEILKRKRVEYSDVISIRCSTSPPIQLRQYSLEPNKVALIRPNGDVKLDCITPFVFGNIKRESLQEIWDNGLNCGWKNKKVEQFIESVKHPEDLVHNPFAIPHRDHDIYLGEMNAKHSRK